MKKILVNSQCTRSYGNIASISISGDLLDPLYLLGIAIGVSTSVPLPNSTVPLAPEIIIHFSEQ